MPELTTAAMTAVFGVIVYVGGQATQRFFLEPIQEQRKVLGEIAYALHMYGNVGQVAESRARGLALAEHTPPEDVSKTIRSLAARLQSLYVVPMYRVLAVFRIVPSKDSVLTAIGHLTAWSNSIYSGAPVAEQDAVAIALRIPRRP